MRANHVCAIERSSIGPSANQVSTYGSFFTPPESRRMSVLPIKPRRSSAMRRGLCGRTTISLSDADLRCRQAKLLFSDHRLPPTIKTRPAMLEPIISYRDLTALASHSVSKAAITVAAVPTTPTTRELAPVRQVSHERQSKPTEPSRPQRKQ